MRTMSKRFIKRWKTYPVINPILRKCPVWMLYAIQYDADIRCKVRDRISLFVND